jgi:DMSO reductase anchor subunit
MLGQRSPRLARAGALCLTTISLGAIASHAHVGDPPYRATPAVAALALCAPLLARGFRRDTSPLSL